MSRRKRERRTDEDEPEPLEVVADYHDSPLGPGCWATITAPDMTARTVKGDDVHDALHRVIDAIGHLADEQPRPVLTMHTLDGDPVAFAELATELGFVDCVGADPRTAGGVVWSEDGRRQ